MGRNAIFWAFLRDISNKLGKRFFALVLLSALCAVTDGLRMLVAFLLLPFVGVSTQNSGAGFLNHANSFLNKVGIPNSFSAVVTLVILVFTAQAALSFVNIWYQGYYTHYYTLQWRQLLFKALSRARWRYFLDASRGEILNALSQETARLSTATAKFLVFLSNLLIAIAYFGASLFVSFQATVLMAAVGVFVAVFNSVILSRLMTHATAIIKGNNQMMVVAQEFLSNVKAIKAAPHGFTVERVVAQPLNSIFVGERIGFLLPNGSRIAAELFVMIALVMAVSVVHSTGLYRESSDVLMVLVLFMRAYGKITITLTALQQMYAQLPAFEYVSNVYRRAHAAEEPQWQDGANCTPADFQNGVAFESVDVIHETKYALKNVSVKLAPRTVVALVGPSGAGKTTFVDTLLRLIDVDAGRISVNGRDVREFNVQSWRSCFGYVSQDFTLISGTLADNIRLFKPDACDEQVVEAAKLSHAHEFISALPRGYDTHLGEMGMKLSGGQRQRIAVARALINDPAVLIFDEATSALDVESEQRVMDAVREMRSKKLIILIAHRLSTVREADEICVFEAGQLVERGDWQSLIAQGGLFLDLWQRLSSDRSVTTLPNTPPA